MPCWMWTKKPLLYHYRFDRCCRAPKGTYSLSLSLSLSYKWINIFLYLRYVLSTLCCCCHHCKDDNHLCRCSECRHSWSPRFSLNESWSENALLRQNQDRKQQLLSNKYSKLFDNNGMPQLKFKFGAYWWRFMLPMIKFCKLKCTRSSTKWCGNEYALIRLVETIAFLDVSQSIFSTQCIDAGQKEMSGFRIKIRGLS